MNDMGVYFKPRSGPQKIVLFMDLNMFLSYINSLEQSTGALNCIEVSVWVLSLVHS